MCAGFFPDCEINTYTDALAAVIGAMQVDRRIRNVLVTHQFVTGALRCDSEEVSVGGSDQVDASVFEPFDYVALGHLHGPQYVGRETVRYCGTPLKYSFRRRDTISRLLWWSLAKRGEVFVRTVPLSPLRDMVELRGTYNELTLRSFYEGKGYSQNYVHITLTDEDDIPDAIGKLRILYPYLMRAGLRQPGALARPERLRARRRKAEIAPGALEEFYEKQNGQPMGEEQRTPRGRPDGRDLGGLRDETAEADGIRFTVPYAGRVEMDLSLLGERGPVSHYGGYGSRQDDHL